MEQSHPQSEDEHVAKRSRRTNESEDKQDNNTTETKVADSNEAQSEIVEATCVLCMDEGTALNPILPQHQCTQCAPDAWKVCLVCNEALLSRLCPVCRTEYAPNVMYRMPGISIPIFVVLKCRLTVQYILVGLPFKKLADASLSEEEKSSLLYKFGIVRQLIGKSNVAAWSPSKEKMYFSLPSRLIDNSADGNYIVTSISLSPGDVDEAAFNFTNKIWDAIENEVETGATQAGESVDYQSATQFILNVTKEDNHRLYTMLSPSDWDYMLNPETSADINETLKSIKTNILHKVEGVIPKSSAEETPSSEPKDV